MNILCHLQIWILWTVVGNVGITGVAKDQRRDNKTGIGLAVGHPLKQNSVIDAALLLNMTIQVLLLFLNSVLMPRLRGLCPGPGSRGTPPTSEMRKWVVCNLLKMDGMLLLSPSLHCESRSGPRCSTAAGR